MKFTLILYIVCLILIGCKNTNNEVIDKKTPASREITQIIVNNGSIGFSYEPVPENEVPFGLPKGDSSVPNWHLDHGSISKIIESSISRIRVNYYSSEWENIDSVIQFLIGILQDSESRTFNAPVWAQPFFLSIMCSIDYNNGAAGRWLIAKDRWTSCIEDQSGKIWFATHTNKSFFPKKEKQEE
ncbi:MAG: hypothetical protein H8E57_06440 [Candidatus Cloacimonetes bacterium]|nr:hypothetical protein [Candidatus Cloacimonadota bacterium]